MFERFSIQNVQSNFDPKCSKKIRSKTFGKISNQEDENEHTTNQNDQGAQNLSIVEVRVMCISYIVISKMAPCLS